MSDAAPGRTGPSAGPPPWDAPPPTRTWTLTLALLVAVPFCLAAAAFELTRALAGNGLSWAYVVEWPLIGGYLGYMWRRLTRERRETAARAAASDDGAPVDEAPVDEAPVDEGLRAWQEYLAQLHAQDPPGGPGR